MRAIVVAHARPLVRPIAVAAGASIVVAVPGHSPNPVARLTFRISHDSTRETRNRDNPDRAEIEAADESSA